MGLWYDQQGHIRGEKPTVSKGFLCGFQNNYASMTKKIRDETPENPNKFKVKTFLFLEITLIWGGKLRKPIQIQSDDFF